LGDVNYIFFENLNWSPNWLIENLTFCESDILENSAETNSYSKAILRSIPNFDSFELNFGKDLLIVNDSSKYLLEENKNIEYFFIINLWLNIYLIIF
jgi:hypothetical protein